MRYPTYPMGSFVAPKTGWYFLYCIGGARFVMFLVKGAVDNMISSWSVHDTRQEALEAASKP